MTSAVPVSASRTAFSLIRPPVPAVVGHLVALDVLSLATGVVTRHHGSVTDAPTSLVTL